MPGLDWHPASRPAGRSLERVSAYVSAFELFSIGVGPSSSHTVGPMRAARDFATRLREEGLLERVERVTCTLYGSLGATGIGHGTPDAVVAGLQGLEPETVDPDAVNRVVTSADEALVRPVLADHIPAANGQCLTAKTCLYTVTPDHDFIIDRAPGHARVIVASPCSGHGFKFAPVIGEILADVALNGATRHDISRFALNRF